MHDISLPPLIRQQTAIFDPTISLDDTHDLKNTSCTIRKIKYGSRKYYQQHMNKYHKNGKDTPITTRTKTAVDPNIQSDPNDPNFFCRSCQKVYPSQYHLRAHIHHYHPEFKMKKSQDHLIPIIMEIDARHPNNKRCTICEREFANRYSYIRHMDTIHKDGKREPRWNLQKEEKQALVIVWFHLWDDPNNYCRSCRRAYGNKYSYQRHLKAIHRNVLQESMKLATLSSTT